MNARIGVVLLLLVAAPARAGFEDIGFNPRSVAMGGAFTAVSEDLSAVSCNPANLGSIKRLQTGSNYLRLFHIGSGEADSDVVNLAGALPVSQEIINGTFGLAYVYNRLNGLAIDRTTAFSYGTRGFRELDGGGVELGATFKVLSRTLDSSGGASKPTLDFGMVYRFREKYAAGLSLLNINRPRLPGPGQRAPATVKIGVSESVRGFTMALELTKREPSGSYGPSTTLAAGLEHWWASARRGSLAVRTGLNLGDRSKAWNWGLAWRILGGEVAYAMTVPMQGKSMVGHSAGLVFRFGQSNPEGEYEKILGEEMRYRKELIASLEAGEVKQWKLSEELRVLREELEALHTKLVQKTLSEAEAKKKLAELQDRQRKAQEAHQKLLEESRKLKAKTKQDFYDEDWSAYVKLKVGGAPDAVLADHARRILRDYKDSGVDLSEANQELLRLLRGQ